jgi:hypothetical protein
MEIHWPEVSPEEHKSVFCDGLGFYRSWWTWLAWSDFPGITFLLLDWNFEHFSLEWRI